jgi:hypothetical protein
MIFLNHGEVLTKGGSKTSGSRQPLTPRLLINPKAQQVYKSWGKPTENLFSSFTYFARSNTRLRQILLRTLN